MSAPKVQIMPIRRLVPPATKSKRKSTSPSKTERNVDASQTAARRTRTGKPKVKTGCLTCKIRRIKCDEMKPACDKCTSTGRKCDGYVPAPSKAKLSTSPSTAPMLYRALDVNPGSSAEKRAFDFFRCRTAPMLASYFDANFWNEVVLQMGQCEPVIRHAMVAVGALYEKRQSRANITGKELEVLGDPFAPNVPFVKHAEDHNDPFALHQYNKAIAHLTQRLATVSPDSADIALLACILFVCVEFLRSDDLGAVQHFNSGMSIVLGVKSAPKKRAIREQLIPFFHRLELLFMLFGNYPTWKYPVSITDAVPTKFNSLTDARDSAVHLMNRTVRFIHESSEKKYSDTVTLTDVKNQIELLSGLEAWKTTFNIFMSTHQLNLSLRDMQAATLLDLHRLAAVLWLKRCLSPLETVTDVDNPLYDTAVSLAEILQTNQEETPIWASHFPPTNPAPFLFDMETVSPLYLIASKCRHPITRRRAIACLQSQTRREGLWDSNVAAAVATRTMEIEEAGLGGVLDGSVLPPEEMRVHNARIGHREGLHTVVHVEFLTFPRGRSPEGRWVGGTKQWNEVILMEK